MITRILIFLALLIGWLVVYRLVDPTGSQQLLNNIQHLSFSGNKDSSYTTTVLDGNGTTVISQTGNSLTTLSTGATGTGITALSLLTQIWTITDDIIQNNTTTTGSMVDTGNDNENDDILDAINALINPAEEMTGTTAGTTITTWTIASWSSKSWTNQTTIPKTIPIKPITKTTTTVKANTTTSPSSLSQKDRNDASHFLQFMDVE